MEIIIKESQLKSLINEQGGSNRKTTQDFVDTAKKIHSDDNGNPLYDYSLVDYKNSGTKVKIICPKHKYEQLLNTGHEYFEILPHKHTSSKQGCRFCYIERLQKYSDSDLEREAKKFKTASEFKNNSFLLFNAAQKRGQEFYKKIASHFVPEKDSAGEKLVAKILVENGYINSECLESRLCDNREKTFKDCTNRKKGRSCRLLRFDFFIPQLNLAIEYDGEPHFNPSYRGHGNSDRLEDNKKHDLIKNEFCKKNNINLIRIHYKVPFKEIEKKLLSAIKDLKPITFIGDYGESMVN